MEEKSGTMGGHGEHGRRSVLASSPRVPVKQWVINLQQIYLEYILCCDVGWWDCCQLSHSLCLHKSHYCENCKSREKEM